jgi:hypothetical protein
MFTKGCRAHENMNLSFSNKAQWCSRASDNLLDCLARCVIGRPNSDGAKFGRGELLNDYMIWEEDGEDLE